MSDYTEHARLSPSGSKKWLACPGSLVLEEPIPNKSSDASDEGTAMHAIAAFILTAGGPGYGKPAASWIGGTVPVNAKNEPFRKVDFTEEMADLVQGYCDTVNALAEGNTLMVEKRVEFSEFVGVPDQFGTCDVAIIDELAGELFVIDLKTGHRPVDVVKNTQGMLYALGVLALLNDGGDPEFSAFDAARARGISTIRLGIYQPKVRAGLSEWSCTLTDLVVFASEARVKAQCVEGARESFPKMDREQWDRIYLNPAPNDQECAFCRAMATCPAAAKAVIDTVGADFSVVAAEDYAYDLTQADIKFLNEKMGATAFIEQFAKAVRGEVERRLLAGHDMPDYGLELGRKPARKWGNDDQVEETLRKKYRLTVEETYNLKLKSPTQLEAMCDEAKVKKLGPDAKPALGPRQWAAVKALIVQGEPSPSVKPKSVIKTPYTVPKLDSDAFTEVTVDDGSDLI